MLKRVGVLLGHTAVVPQLAMCTAAASTAAIAFYDIVETVLSVPPSGMLSGSLQDIDGKPFNFEQLRGKPVYAVNVASQ